MNPTERNPDELGPPGGAGSLEELTPELYPEGNEQLSEAIDAVVYGI